MSQAYQEYWIKVYEITLFVADCSRKIKNLLWKSDSAFDTWSKAIAKLNGLQKIKSSFAKKITGLGERAVKV